MEHEIENAPQIAEGTGTTIVTDGPTRSEMIQSAMQSAVDDLFAAHNQKWTEWNARENQNDGVEAPVLMDSDIRDAKINARSKAKTLFHASAGGE